jgi:hypothetical protein
MRRRRRGGRVDGEVRQTRKQVRSLGNDGWAVVVQQSCALEQHLRGPAAADHRRAEHLHREHNLRTFHLRQPQRQTRRSPQRLCNHRSAHQLVCLGLRVRVCVYKGPSRRVDVRRHKAEADAQERSVSGALEDKLVRYLNWPLGVATESLGSSGAPVSGVLA